MKLDILAFGAHPDDIELACVGTLINEIKKGKKVGVIDLTEGELGTRGDVETRYKESAASSKIIGLHARENLQLQDGFFRNDKESQLKVIQMIRKYQPEIILSNALHDRHPDHGRGSELLRDSYFLSGLMSFVWHNRGQVKRVTAEQIDSLKKSNQTDLQDK